MNRFAIIGFITFLCYTSFGQSYFVEGFANLEYQSNHSGIKVTYNRFAPTALTYVVYTDSTGYYSEIIDEGVYDIDYEKDGYHAYTNSNVSVYQNQVLLSVTLESTGLSGPLSGTLFNAAFVVSGNIEVLEDDTLILLPGTELYFLQDLTFSIRGTLIAQGEYHDSVVFSNAIEGETWKGLKVFTTGEADLSHVIIEHASTSGIYVSGNCAIDYSFIRDNTGTDGGGVRMNTGGTVSISNSRIYRNSANVGGGIFLGYITDSGVSSERPLISNNLIYGNTANTAAAMYFYVWYYGGFRPPLVINCTFSNNTCLNSTGVLECDPQTALPSLINNIISNNTGYGLMFTNGAYYYGFNNCYDNTLGNYYNPPEHIGTNVTININGDSCDASHNIQMDPMFMDMAGFDFHLLYNSPCIDAGFNDSVFTSFDFDGNIRKWDAHNYGTAHVDMGPFEHGSIVGLPEDDAYLSELICYPNPTTSLLNISEFHGRFCQVKVIDLAGRVQLSFKDVLKGKSIDLSSLNSGIYLLRTITDENEVYTAKVLKN